MVRPYDAMRFIVLLTLCGAYQPAQAQDSSCDVTVPLAGQIVPTDGSHDTTAISRAVRAATNRARCDNGLSPLATDPALIDTADGHSQDMLEKGFFDHTSPVEGRETLQKRVEAADVSWTMIAENIIEGYFLNYENGESYVVIDEEACEFRNAETDEPYRRLTYAEMGDELVARWMDSPGHRENILTPDLTRHGFAMVVDTDAPLCGKAIATQVFAG